MPTAELVAKLRRINPRTRKLAAIGLGIWAATALLAFLWPLAEPPQLDGSQENMDASGPAAPPKEDLNSFLRSTRWGVSLAEMQAREAEAAEAAKAAKTRQLNPELRKMGFVGFFMVPEQTSILLVMENGAIKRFNLGDALPDGRTLAKVDENRLTLSGPDEQKHELLLFPEIG